MAESGLRIVIMPSFSGWYALDLCRQADGSARGVLSRPQRPPWSSDAPPPPPVEIVRYNFRVGAEEYRDVFACLTGGWRSGSA